MSKRPRRKPQLQRAAPQFPPGGALMYVPAHQLQNVYGQTFYGSQTANVPVGQTALFNPGTPLPTQPGVNVGGNPVQYKYVPQYNTFPVDRTQNVAEMPSFEQLRRLAMMDYGCTLCERYWLDMVPRLKLQVKLKDEYVADGAEEKDYQKEITYFKNFFSKPDGNLNIHEWVQQILIDRSQIDEVYLYKHRTRGGKLLGLWIVAGDQMKQLLDVWGRLPDGREYAYQQYPWGIPGMQYTRDQIIHRRETPASTTPYGRSRVERVLLVTNAALKKMKQDLAYFKRNTPGGILMPPGDGSNQWTSDQLDAYQQSWDALMSGNLDLLYTIRVVQPGFTYTPFVQPPLDAVIDRYWLNIRASAYGVPMDELGFTDNSNRSVGQTQQDVVYRRTIGPHTMVIAEILTDVMNNDFDPSLHGEMFDVVFGGYEEQEDELGKAQTLSTYTGAGILGLTAAAKLAKLPEEPDAQNIGRMLITKEGPIFLDDMATDEMRKAATQAKLAGFQMAANPPQEQDENDTGAQTNAKAEESSTEDSRGGNSKDATTAASGSTAQSRAAWNHSDAKAASTDYRNWRSRAIEDVKHGRLQRAFSSDVIPEYVQAYLSYELALCKTPDDVRALFKRVQDHQMEVVQQWASL